MKTTPAKTGLIVCDVLQAETERRLADMPQPPEEIRFLPMGRHDTPDLLRKELQEVVDELEAAGCRRLLFVYGLCSNSILGLRAQTAEMIFPRAHDCITLFLGSRQRYADVQRREPGTFWFSPGWCREKRVPGPGHFEEREAAFREQFDEEEVEFLLEMEHERYRHYTAAGYTDLGDGDTEGARRDAEAAAAELGMKFVHHPGDDQLLHHLLNGPWPEEDFMVVPPGKEAVFTGDERILACRDCSMADKKGKGSENGC